MKEKHRTGVLVL